MSPGMQRKLLRRIAELKQVCRESYQVLGVLAENCGRFDGQDVQNALDNLQHGRPMHQDVLPFKSDEQPRESA